MEVKKNPRQDLEKKRGMFLQIGFLLSFMIVLVAFEYKTPVEEVSDLSYDPLEELDELIPVTVQKQEKPKEPVKIKQIDLMEIIIAENEEEDIDLEIIDSHVSEDDAIDFREVTEDVELEEDVPFVRVENMPIFNPKKNRTYEDGQRDLFITMQKMTKYPVVAQENGIQGKVFVKFVVGKTGEVSNIQVVRSVDPYLDKEAVRVVSNLPKFKPGMQRNKPVSVWFSGYISFVLQ
ncbi:energy transducer TonB [Marinifilum sp. RC60d5]|uniref:energy transducer TonB n=1 Tax=Marinifilum sp. RC60d5 TaxID=3458414 RepID=UPI004035530E